MIDYERAEAQAALLLRTLLNENRLEGRRRCAALRLACLIAGFEFLVILVGALWEF